MILVDTSAWIAFFRNRGQIAEEVDRLLEEDNVALCGPVLTELRRGLSPRERPRVLPLLAGCHLLDEPESMWIEAGEIGYLLRRSGRTIKTIDLLIATYALAHDVPMLTLDRDFEIIERTGLGIRLHLHS